MSKELNRRDFISAGTAGMAAIGALGLTGAPERVGDRGYRQPFAVPQDV
jgi:hypothetical protein